MRQKSGFSLVEVIVASGLLVMAMLFFAAYMSQITRNRKYLSSFSDFNIIESSLRLALQDRETCANILGSDPDAANPADQIKKIINNPPEGFNTILPEAWFKLTVDGGNKFFDYEALKFGDTYIVKKNELRSSGLKINRLQFHLHSTGARQTKDAGATFEWLYWGTLLIGGDYRSSLQSNIDPALASTESNIKIPLLITVREDGTFLGCSSGRISTSQGRCRVVTVTGINAVPNPNLPPPGFAVCALDEELVLGGAKCQSADHALVTNYPFVGDWWVARCADPALDSLTNYFRAQPQALGPPWPGVLIYGYCCPR